ncbi:uncharacterized protein TRIVIDRAFT_65511 [Trichoderma virens Gv29-8]|uniref:F-box domain-containing protein n=1 Tax=Hypocrea virens (strain Gv29-8 / FGSC 10586) TaxID=413071 RepID=G9N9X2_HYPVG|nr:uncharacterized protein TRIVIDRAFT_65511 [Trichoderma virens Gv29-8]EHK16740.1 hypothetical protein TRIVIDRAFT_65511 [Trichoderma virens Gv29-8]UKZ51882.1 hypothetical protein TrVGV298_005647 [Trichoderma virens]
MFVLMRWAQKFYPFKNSDCLREQDDGKEKVGQPEQPRLFPTLGDLQRTMDPLVAVQVYNYNSSPICRLPDELLLHIIHFLGDDILAMHCLRRVSWSFRRLINKSDMMNPLLLQLSLTYESLSESSWSLPANLREQLRQRLQRDGMCDECKLWCDVPVKGWLKQIIQASNLSNLNHNRAYWSHCKFGFRSLRGRPQCDTCGNHQDVQASSSSSSKHHRGARERQCLGCQGAVQLCEHIHISWATIEAHLTDWQQRKPGDWQACFDNFDIECHDPSHDTRCRPEEAPT